MRKSEIRMSNKMSNNESSKYDLEERTLNFAKKIRGFVKKLPRSMAVMEDSKQLVRSSGSVGANYIEAYESLGKKDFLLRLKTARKESKEARYWLILTEPSVEGAAAKEDLVQEANELLRILSSIIEKSRG